ncbi:MAG: DUF6607 family protein [Planctomycetota bacterium]
MLRILMTVTVVVSTLLFAAATAIACPNCDAQAKPAANPAAATLDFVTHPPHHQDQPQPTAPEADRQAILAMAGEYRVTFQFQETVGMVPGYELHEPYHSEATEFVEVIEDTGDFISLQHVLVMPRREGGEPVVVKHWRQDWTFQDPELLAFRGNLTWERVELDPADVQGTWSQAVFQVDDSPRYESFGTWQHVGDRSAWESAETWRPLPRREFSKRSDYQVLVAQNRHTITPEGWVHEQDNHKLVLDGQGQPQTVLAHESGLNVYDRTDEIDFTAGRVYWEETAAYWQDVRTIWADTFAQHDSITLAKEIDGQKLHAVMFEHATDVRTEGHSAQSKDAANSTILSFLSPSAD